MDTCGDCIFYDSIDGAKGECKQTNIERHVVEAGGSIREIINGWPVTKVDEKACGEFAQA